MNREITSQLERARKLYSELRAECEKRKGEAEVHTSILNIAVEVLAKLRSILDHTAFCLFETKIQPLMAPDQARKVRVYFPIADDEPSFNSQIGRSRLSDLERESPLAFRMLRDAQPFASEGNRWLASLRDLSNRGKHVKLVAQQRQVTKRTTVMGPGGSVSWGEGVTFGSGVSIMGTPVNPQTQDIVPTPGLTSRTEYLVSFEFPEAGVNALGFLAEAIDAVEALTDRLLKSL